MYVNRYEAPSGDEYDGCGRFDTKAKAEEAALSAVRYAMEGTKWVATRFKPELAHAA